MSAPWPTLSAPPVVDLPPWNWNPTQTFIDAYNTQRIADQKAEEMQMANELERILLPAKIAQAEYATKKLAHDSKLLERIYRTEAAALDRSYEGVASAIGGSTTASAPKTGLNWNAWGAQAAQPSDDDDSVLLE